MSIVTTEAVDAVARALTVGWDSLNPGAQFAIRNQVMAVLNQAAPHMEAKALALAAAQYPAMSRDMVSRSSVKAWLHARADACVKPEGDMAELDALFAALAANDD